MTRVEILSGICGFTTVVEANADKGNPYLIHLTFESDCPAVNRLGAELPEVDAFQESTYRGEGPRTLQHASQCLDHPSCPVPLGIIKAVEVAAGLALPKDVVVRVLRD